MKVFTQEKLQEIYPNIFKEESTEQISNRKAKNIIYNEGISFAVGGYCSYNIFKDPITRALWINAGIAIQELKEYIDNNIEREENV